MWIIKSNHVFLMMKSDHTRSQPARAVSPSLVAAKNVNVNRDFLDDGERKVMILKIMLIMWTLTGSLQGGDHYE